MVQHRQPVVSVTSPSSACSTSRWSRPTSPNSLMTTAVSVSAGSLSRRLSSVVLPAPRKPVSTLYGIGGARRPPGGGAPAPVFFVWGGGGFGSALRFAFSPLLPPP